MEEKYVSGPDGLEQERDALKAINAELLEALKGLLEEDYGDIEHPTAKRARAAIAKAEGKT